MDNINDKIRKAQTRINRCYLPNIAEKEGYLCDIYYPMTQKTYPVTPLLEQASMYQSNDLDKNYNNVPDETKRYLAFNIFQKENRASGNALLDSFLTGDEPYLISTEEKPKDSIVLVFNSGDRIRFFSFKILHCLETPSTNMIGLYYKIMLEPYT
jgi:hypothetical protein